MNVVEKLLLVCIDFIVGLIFTVLSIFLLFTIADFIFGLNIRGSAAILGDAAKGAAIAYIYGYYKFYRENGYFTSWFIKYAFTLITKPLVKPIQRKSFLMLIAGLIIISVTLLLTKQTAINFINDYTFNNYYWLFTSHQEHKLQVAYNIGLFFVLTGFFVAYAYKLVTIITNPIYKFFISVKNWIS